MLRGYEQIDGVIIGALLDPILANKIMTEKRNQTSEKLMKEKVIIC